MKIAVTGATGFLGQHTCRHLLACGHSVIGLGRNPDIGQQLRNAKIQFERVDLSDENAMQKHFDGCDAVVHCAALSSPWGKWQDFHHTNVQGTENVILACKAASVKRLIHISSPSIYSELADTLNISESHPVQRPLNNYAKSKRLAECLVDQHTDANLECITLRPQAIFGPGDNSIIPRLIEANQTRGIPVIRGGNHLLDVTYVKNVAIAIEKSILASSDLSGRHYNISNGTPISFIPFLSQLFEQLNTPIKKKNIPYPFARVAASILEKIYATLPISAEPPLTRYTLSVLAFSRTLDISAAQRELSYQPAVSIDDGIQQYVASLNSTD